MNAALATRPLTSEQGELVRRNLGLAFALARRFPFSRRDLDSALSDAMLGLCQAARSYRASDGPFVRYAGRAIRNEMWKPWQKQRRADNSGTAAPKDRHTAARRTVALDLLFARDWIGSRSDFDASLGD